MTNDPHDPRGLIRESFRMEAISQAECRTIFLDWALGLPIEADTETAVRSLLARYAAEPADHPMMVTLQSALSDPPPARRRGGRRARARD